MAKKKDETADVEGYLPPGSEKPQGWKLCPSCEGLVKGPRTKACPKCGHTFEAKVKEGSGLIRSPAARNNAAPTLDDLMKVQELAREHGGIEAFTEKVEGTLKMLNDFGGIERVHAALKGLKALGVE